MEILFEHLARFWSDLISRPDGPLALRFVLQPVMSTLMAIRDGTKDGKTGRHPYLLFIVSTDTERRKAALAEGLNATGKILLFGTILDVVYQLRTFGGFYYPVETLVIAVFLAFLPYLLVRGPVARITRRGMKQSLTKEVARD